MKTIASNAGVEGAVIVGKVLELDSPSMGYNAATGEFTDMVKSGIIDPLKVRVHLQSPSDGPHIHLFQVHDSCCSCCVVCLTYQA